MIHMVSFSGQVLSFFCNICWESSLCLKSSRFEEIYGLLMKLILFFLTSQVIQKFFLKVKNAYECVCVCVYIFLLIPVTICFCYLVTMSCPILCDLMYCSLPGSSVHGILQTRILEWVAIPSSRGSSRHRDSNPSLLLWQADSLPLSHQGSPTGSHTSYYGIH